MEEIEEYVRNEIPVMVELDWIEGMENLGAEVSNFIYIY